MESESCEIRTIGSLGLIASIFKEYGLVERIDKLLPKTSNNYNVTHGEVVFAMVLQGLGFSGQRLYLAASYFSQVSLYKIFRDEVRPEHFNGTTMSRTLDAIFDYGCTRFFVDTCLATVLKHKLLNRYIFIDTTSFSVSGKKYKGDGNINLNHGFSKDHRFDLKQLVFLLATTNNGIPLYAESHSGKTTDSSIFQKTILNIQNTLKSELDKRVFVLDSSLYSRNFLVNENIEGNWITRVPESVKDCRNALQTRYFTDEWVKLDNNYSYVELSSGYGGKAQRWVLIRHRTSKYSELSNLDKKLDKEEHTVEKALRILESRVFLNKADAISEIKIRMGYHPLFSIDYSITSTKKRIKGSKRKITTGYKLLTRFDRNLTAINQKKRRKGKFILATNCLDRNEISTEEIIEAYRSRNNNIEKCFKFYKDRKKSFNKFCFKKESRIEAVLSVMTLSLFINNLAEKKLKDHLKETDETVPDQRCKPTKKPTFFWIQELMRNVYRVKFKFNGKLQEEVNGLYEAQKTIVRAFGKYARSIYGFP